ncbi:MAG: SusC/RagA family TonB-linked outer membrane protein [Bacteroidota bacterium]
MKKMQKFILFLAFLIPIGMLAQTKVSGVVTEQSTGVPLLGVNVIIKGTSIGTTTDFDGKYQISASNGQTIVFSYVGYISQEIAYTGQATLDVTLLEDTSALDEVVIIGYGTTTKKDATGSVEVISADDFNKGAIVSADQLLQGKAAGVRITNNGGSPDSAPNIRIRGGASLSANNSPLIVIDGVALDNGGTAGVANPLNLINPNDIESFSILKDASATAIYGSRASNGVIIITTKKGSSGEPQFSFSANTTLSSISDRNIVDVMNSDEFVSFIQEFHPDETNKLGVPVGSVLTSESPSQIITASDGTQREIYASNWQDGILRSAISQDYNFSARANLFGKIPFRASIGYNNSEGVVSTDDYERVSASLKLTPKLLDDHLTIDVNAKGLYIEKNAIDGDGALGGSLAIDPTKPVFDNGSIFGGFYNQIGSAASTTPNALIGATNPLALLEQRQRPEIVRRLLANVQFDYKFHFLPELSAVLNLGTESSRTTIEERFSENAVATYRQTETAGDFIFNPGVNFKEEQHITNVTMEGYLQYKKELDSDILKSFDVQGGYAYQNFKNDGNKEEFIYAAVPEQGEVGTRIVNFDPNNPNNRFFNELNLQSFFGRSNLNFADKYLLTVSFRADGSSLFNENDRWGYFPAAALAWKLKEEKFLENVNFVNDLKVRASWGLTGQQDITGLAGFYPSVPLFQIGGVTSQYLEGVNLYSAIEFNPNLTWETTSTYNLGLDFAFFESGFLSGSFDIYKRFTNDLLVLTNVPPGQALSDLVIQNVGETESEGFELNLNADIVNSEDFSLSLNSNISYNRTEVTSLDGATQINQTPTIPNGTGTFLFQHALGEQAYSAFVYKQIYDSDGNPIPNAFVDLNGDNQINDEDRYYQAIRPNWTYGFGLNATYKNWDLSASFRGQLDGKIYNSARLQGGYTDRAIESQNEALNNVLNFNSGAANAVFTDIQDNQALSDYFLEDAWFLRCENITLGYTLDGFFKNTRLRLYGAVNNPFLITNYSGQDPENFNGLDNNFYPRPTAYTLGLNFDF